MIYNKAINPKEGDSYSASLMPSRSARITKVIDRDCKDAIGGATDVKNGTVWVPQGDTAKERTIRFHEALHVTHTSPKTKMRDLLDQALEDARLHRYCSKSSTSEYDRARRDELVTTLRELRQIRRMPSLNAPCSLATLRSMGIILAGTTKPQHTRLLESIVSRFGPKAMGDFLKALSILKDCNGDTAQPQWSKARGVLKRYFASDFRKDAPKSPSGGDQGDKDDSKGTESPSEDKDGEETEKDTTPGKDMDTGEDEDKDSSDSPESDTDEDESDSEDSGTDEDKESGEEGDGSESSDMDSDSDSSSTGDSIPDDRIAPKAETPTPKRVKVSPDEYTGDLAPSCDREQFEEMTERYPLKLFIRRLDMGINRVKLSLGRKSPLPVTSGRQILARKLAGALTTPGVRTFARPVATGGYGTILVDASSSMMLPEATFIEFLKNAPALTIAFYNAPNDRTAEHGNIWIYAANGYRATMADVSMYDQRDIPCPLGGWGSGNLIDYHAIAWLIKQPAPHYIVTDQRWTGTWVSATRRLVHKLVPSGDLIIVRTLEDMEEILEKKAKGR